jgi:excisionase family DNA binding protein
MRKIASNDELMTTRQAGEVLGVAVRTVQLWVESGVLPAWRTAGGHRRISRGAVEKLLAERSKIIRPAPQASTVVAPATSAFKLLLVEDDPDLMRLFTLMIEGWELPIDLVTATNGFDGLVRIGQARPDMVITDLNMPGMDGFQMLRALKKPGSGYENLEIVVVTALTPGDIRDRGGLPAGAEVFHKPVPFEQLYTLVHSRCREKLVKPLPV